MLIRYSKKVILFSILLKDNKKVRYNMFFDTNTSNVFRPPSEANSFILRITRGCAHNKCTYCNMYRGVRFEILNEEEVSRQIALAIKAGKNTVRRIFLADGDALVVPTARLLKILAVLKDSFPHLNRVSSYAAPKDILRKSPEELKALKEAGLTLLYYGMETGDSEVLERVKKGVNGEESIAAGQKVIAAGMKLSMMIIIGIAGVEGSKKHAIKTAEAINAIKPTMLSALTMMLYRGSELLEEYERGEFNPLSPYQIMVELNEIISRIDLPKTSPCIFRSNHVSNYVQLAGNFPKDKERLVLETEFAIEQMKNVKEYDVYNRGF